MNCAVRKDWPPGGSCRLASRRRPEARHVALPVVLDQGSCRCLVATLQGRREDDGVGQPALLGGADP